MADIEEQDTSLEGSAGIPASNIINPASATPPPAAPVPSGLNTPPPTIPNAPIQPTPTPAAPPPPPQGPSLIRRILARVNIYLLIFILLLIVAGGVIALSVKASKGNNNTPIKVNSLTSAEIASLKGSTTVVGSSKQLLDVQSSSIFEGAILARNNLDVAGNIKVGGNLSLPVLSVSGQTNLNGAAVGGDLTVAGTTDIQGQLTLHKGLTVQGTTSFGNLSAATLSVSSLQLSGDLSLNRHILTSGSTLSKSSGTALGSGGTASVSGNDTAGTININIGGSPAAGLFISVTFAHAYSTTPHVIVTPIGSSAGGLQYYVTRSTTGFSVGTSAPATAGTNFAFDYFVVQ